MKPTHSQAIIIGAGMAGLKAAIELTKAGVCTTILEARDRLGGRMLSETSPGGHIVDIGASWFHDCLTNPLLKKYYTHQNKGSKADFAFDDSGLGIYAAQGPIDLSELQIQPVANEINTYLQEVVGVLPANEDMSLRDACLNYLREKKYILTPAQLRYAHQMTRYFEMWVGISWTRISARTIAMNQHASRDLLLLNGYMTVYNGELAELLDLANVTSVEEVQKENTSNLSIKLNTEAFQIAKNSVSGVIEVSTKCQGATTVYTCDYIIVTTPLSILKLTDPKEKGCITWVPPLPSPMRKALDSVGFCHLGKVFFEFEEEFWPNIDRMYVMADDDLAFDKALSLGVPLADEEFTTEGIEMGKGQLTSPILFVSVSNVLRRKGVTGKTPMLLALTSEPLTHKVELCYRKGDIEGVVNLMAPSISRVTNIPIKDLPKPTSVRATEWSFDEYSRGTYLGRYVGANVDRPGIINSMSNPSDIFGETGVSRVRFAGEGTTHYGTGCVHGAWVSGDREAQIIRKLINETTSSTVNDA